MLLSAKVQAEADIKSLLKEPPCPAHSQVRQQRITHWSNMDMIQKNWSHIANYSCRITIYVTGTLQKVWRYHSGNYPLTTSSSLYNNPQQVLDKLFLDKSHGKDIGQAWKIETKLTNNSADFSRELKTQYLIIDIWTWSSLPNAVKNKHCLLK